MRLIDADALTRCIPAEEIASRMAVANAPTIEPEQWIPVSERLPEVGRSVLFSVGDMYTAEGCLRSDGDWEQFRWLSIQQKDVVGAWRPLPAPYDGDKYD